MKVIREISIAKVIYVDRSDTQKDAIPSDSYVVQENAPVARKKSSLHLVKRTAAIYLSFFLGRLKDYIKAIFAAPRVLTLGYGSIVFYIFFIVSGFIASSVYMNRYHTDAQARTGIYGGFESAYNGGVTGISKPLQSDTIVRDCTACPAMAVIPSGSFVMGSPLNEEGRFIDEGPQRTVQVNGFLLGIYEVTQAEWISIMGENPSYFKKCGSNCPIESITYDEIQEYFRRLSRLTGKQYRLPTEAEWEYSARAGTKTAFPWGESFDPSLANNSSSLGPVGRLKSNGFGVHDMHGNVWEYVQDPVSPNYVGAPSDGSAPNSNGSPSLRVIRGGSFGSAYGQLRSAYRGSATIIDRYRNIGFRVARDAVSEVKSGDEVLSFRKTDRESQLYKGKETSAGTPRNVATDSSPSIEYVRILTNLIRSSVSNLDPEKKLSIDLLIKIELNGSIKSVEVKRGSGDSAWDESILAAVKKIRKFPPDENGRIPSTLVDEGLLVTYKGS